MSERKRYHKDNAPTDDIITLINLVRQNPALYNYKLQPNQRRRPDIISGWEEVSQQMGYKYSVQEVRRKWKNLRDTYHQYRRRTPKCIEGRLSKWRYAKQLDFLSKIYQPKLKAHRIAAILQAKKEPGLGDDDADADDADDDDDVHHDDHDHDYKVDHDDHDVVDDDGQSDTTALSSSHHTSSQITLVSDEAETFILTAYEESVADDTVPTHHHHHHSHHQQQQQQQHHHHHHQHQHQQHHHHHHHQTQHDGSISSIELTRITPDDDEDDELDDDCDDVVDIVKHELDEDGATVAEVDYEEVCLYEEAGGACEIGVDGSSDVTDSKGFHYIDAEGFCIEDMEAEPETETDPETQTEPEPITVPETRTTVTTVPLRHASHVHAHHYVSSGTASNSVLSGSNSVLNTDVKLKNLTLVTTTTTSHAAAAAAAASRAHPDAGGAVNSQQQQIALVDVKEATSTSVTISSAPAAASLTGASPASTVSTTLAASTVATVATQATTPANVTLCNNNSNNNNTKFNATTTHILQLPTLSAATSAGPATSSSISVAASSSTFNKDDKQEMAQALIKRDELDLFFDFLKKKIQYFSKTQITHIQMEFLNCVSRQEVAEQDAKD